MKYKRMTILVPFCKECNERILGNGSKLNPYSCRCGVWIYNPKTLDHELQRYSNSMSYVDTDINTKASSIESE